MSNYRRRNPARRSRVDEQFAASPLAAPEPVVEPLAMPTVLPPVAPPVPEPELPSNGIVIMTGIAVLGMLFCLALPLFSL